MRPPLLVRRDSARSMRLSSRTYLLIGLLAAAVQHAVPQSTSGSLEMYVKAGLYVGVSASAAIALLIGIHRHRPAAVAPWILVGLSQVIYALGDTVFFVRRDLLGLNSYPSVADFLYLGHYLPLAVGLVWLIRRRTPGRDVGALIDGLLIASGCAVVAWTYLINPVYDASTGSRAATAVSLAFPAADIVILAVGLRLVMGAGERTRSFYLLASGLGLLLATDATYAAQQLHGTYTTGNFLDLMWMSYYLLLGAAGLDPSMTRVAEPVASAAPGTGWPRLSMLAAAALTTPAIMLFQQLRHDRYGVSVLGGGAALMFLLVFLRMAGLISAERHAAVTDRMTGLHNRRFFTEQLSLESERNERADIPLTLFILDVDDFKSLNDTYGHAAGDRVLCQVADRLRDAVRPGDVVARIGGGQFAVLASGHDQPSPTAAAEDIQRSIAGVPFVVDPRRWASVTVSIGVAGAPRHTSDARELLTLGHRAMYAAKAAGHNRIMFGRTDMPALVHRTDASDGVVDHLCRLADRLEGYQAPYEHSTAIGRWAAVVAAHVGLDAEAQRIISLAGRLHDIGKIAVPVDILAKPGALTDDEWRLIRTHPDQGRLLLSGMSYLHPVADIVAQHHERFDGDGYPRGLARDRIPIGARIITLCDSFAAMRVDRPYRKTLDVETSRERLTAGRGTQFDPDLTELFLHLLDRNVIGELGSLFGVDDRQQPTFDTAATQPAALPSPRLPWTTGLPSESH